MTILDEFRQAVEIQQQKDDEAYEVQIKLPVSERVAKGITMTNLKVSFNFFDQQPNQWCRYLESPLKFIKSANIYCENNISKFREGAIVVLSNGSTKFKMEIANDSVTEFILQPNNFDVKNCYINSMDHDENNWEINIVKTSITQKLLLDTANNLVHDSQRLAKIEGLLGGTLANPKIATTNFNALNTSQNIAVKKAYSAQDFHLIQGPPGTGKTTTIANIAMLLIESGKNVFVTAPTHTAINNCLNAISKKIKNKSKLIKIGEKYQASEILDNEFITRKPRLTLETYNNSNEFSKAGIIIGGTPYSLCYPASKRLDNWEFDVALIDEAAQMSIPLAISVLSKTNKFIFVGDHMQLDPIMPSGTGNSMFSESIFRRIVKLYPSEKTLLNISYRLNENLIRIPNTLFYDDQLSSDISLAKIPQNINSYKYNDVFNHQDSNILFLHKVFDSKGRSPHEAELVSEFVDDLLKNGVELKNIGILTPYRAQVRELKKAIHKKNGITNPEILESLFIDTVDRMQGQERDYIIYSMSNSHPLESKRRLDFFYSPNRLNVAITRAIKKCIVVANYKVFDIIDDELQELPDFTKLKPLLDVFKEYYKLSTKIEEVQNVKEVW